MTSKKKAQLTTFLDDLRSQDAKKRLAAVMEIRQIASAIGPQRVRSEFITFLGGIKFPYIEFVDDEQNIVLELLGQLQNFSQFLGGPEHQKCIVPLLMSFCKTDQKKQAFKACQIIGKAIENNKEIGLDTIKKLAKTEMVIAKECAAKLISSLINLLDTSETALIELYYTFFYNDNPSHKIIGSKYLQPLLKNCKSKEEVGKMLELVYNQNDDLVKIYALNALVDYYDVNSNMCLTKFKNLSIVNSWRINIKICQAMPAISAKTTKPHFKLIFQPQILKFMTSSEPELRAASCQTFSFLVKNLSDEEVKNKFVPNLKKIAQDPSEFVKVQISKRLVQICPFLSSENINDSILPLVFTFVRETNCEITLGVMKGFDYLSTKVSKDVLQEKIIKPLTLQFNTENWRLKCQILEILKSITHNPIYLSESLLKVLVGLTDDRIDAVRLKVNELIIGIITKQPKDWCDSNIIPKLSTMKESGSYIKRQNLLEIIEKTANCVSEKTLKQIYQNTILVYLTDKVPNVRMKTINVLKNATKIVNPIIQKNLEKLKEDKDSEIRQVVKKLRA